MDERNCTIALLTKQRGIKDPALVGGIQVGKAASLREYTATNRPRLFPGVVEFLTEAGKRYSVAISGASGETLPRRGSFL